MSKLDECRQKINLIDKQMAELFCERMHAAEEIAEYKKSTGMPIFDPKRENEVIERSSMIFPDERLHPYYVDFLKCTMDISKRYQSRLLDGMRIAYSGIEGAFAWIAAKRIFPYASHISYPDFQSAYDAVNNFECDCVLLPLENSYAGDVAQVMDLAFSGQLFIHGIYDLAITQNLLAKKGVQLSDITEVISHPQALSQCAPYIKAHSWKTSEHANTALAAKLVSESDRTDLAVIASRETAALYNLSILSRSINQSSSNTTRFAVFSREPICPNPNNNHFVMFFTVKNEAGALGRAVSVISQHGFNMRALKSRPTGDNNWEYYFYVEGEGNIHSPNGERLLEWLRMTCSSVKICGSFSEEKKLLDSEGNV